MVQALLLNLTSKTNGDAGTFLTRTPALLSGKLFFFFVSKETNYKSKHFSLTTRLCILNNFI